MLVKLVQCTVAIIFFNFFVVHCLHVPHSLYICQVSSSLKCQEFSLFVTGFFVTATQAVVMWVIK